MKIVRLLGLSERPGVLRILEIGAGAGGISQWLANAEGGRFEVHAVDVVDSRQVKDGYHFQLIPDSRLPFDNDSFDIVISNHVIEHVGDDQAQALHLSEFYRVLRKGGLGYLAVPNRWMLVEPHYRLPLLSWWPESWRSHWLRFWQGKAPYDCRPLSRAELERRLKASGLDFEQLHEEALRVTYEIDQPESKLWRHLLRHLPSSVHVFSRSIYPTLIYRVFHPDRAPDSD